MIKFFSFSVLFSLIVGISFSQTAPNKYWLQFSDKNNTPYSVSSPNNFLTQRAIDRRINQGITISENDLPVDPAYVDSLRSLGLTILNTSKWFNAVTVYTTDIQLIDTITNLGFIATSNKIAKTKTKSNTESIDGKEIHITKKSNNLKSFYDYGSASNQITMLNGDQLHDLGFRGQGMLIAITDAGFTNANTLSAFDSLWTNNQIVATKDFVNNGPITFDQHSHGMNVFSIIASNIPGQLVGTAPKANYILLRSEDANSEYRIEEDNWISAAEFADSLGADIINVSLGYETFDDPSQNYTYSEMNGNISRMSRGVDIASSKGILVVVSAGNSGNDPWHYIGVPADADSALTIGSVDSNGNYSVFSSTGPSADGDVKPNITAQGTLTAYQTTSGTISAGNGTSFSAPVITGLVACLWQAHPNMTNMQIIDYIERSASQYNNPDSLKGYGIPDFALANLLIQNIENKNFTTEDYCKFYPNPFTNEIFIEFLSTDSQTVTIEIYDVLGKKLFNKEYQTRNVYNRITIDGTETYNQGTYVIKLTTETKVHQEKILKN